MPCRDSQRIYSKGSPFTNEPNAHKHSHSLIYTFQKKQKITFEMSVYEIVS